MNSSTNIDKEVNSFFGYKELGPFISNIADVAFIVGGAIVFLFIIWGGMEILISGGDKAHTEAGQKRITNAVIGLAIIASSWAIWKIVKAFFGLDAVLPG